MLCQESVQGLQQSQFDTDSSSLKVQRSNYIQSNVHMNTNKMPTIVKQHMKQHGRTLVVQGQKKTYKNSSLKRELQNTGNFTQTQIQAIANQAIQQNIQNVKNLQTQSSGFIAPMATAQNDSSGVQKSQFDVVPKIIYDKVANVDKPKRKLKQNKNRKLIQGTGFTGWGEFPYTGAYPTNSMFAPQQSFNFHKENRLVPDYVENSIRQSRAEEVGSFYDDPQMHNLEGRKELVNYQENLKTLNQTNELLDQAISEMKNLEITKNQIMSKLNGRVEQLRDLLKNSKIFNEFIQEEKQFFQKEKEIEDKEYEDIYMNKDFKVLEEKGFILTNMNLCKIKSIFHKKILLCFRVSKNIQEQKIQKNSKITNNDNVIILPQKNEINLQSTKNHGTVYKITSEQIQILVEEDLNQIEQEKSYMLLKTSDNVTYDRIRLLFKDLQKYKQNEFLNKKLIFKTLRLEDQHTQNQQNNVQNVNIVFNDERLNDTQKNVVKSIMSMNDIFLIHGPPGTGKTKTLAEVCKQLIKRNKKLIICSPSNTGVDNLLSIIIQEKDIKVLRVGNPGRASQQLQDYVLDNQLKFVLKKDSELRKQKMQIQKIQQKLQKVGNKKQEIKNLKQERNQIENSIREYENVVINQVFEQAQVVGATLAGVYDKKFQQFIFNKGNRKFYDYTIIDEAGQSLRSLSYMGIIQSSKLIMAGDHQQLPPTIKQKDIKNYQTLFEQLIKQNFPQAMLDLQYRMNSKIMQISSDFLYHKKLRLGNEIQNQLLSGKNDYFFSEQIQPLIFINTSQAMFGEEANDDSQDQVFNQSKFNIGEAFLVLNTFFIFYQDYNINCEQIGIITPYSAQVDFINKQLQILKENGQINQLPEVKTVDGFQGREKEVIIISCVRSNKQKNYGFLSDIRRMNVAITRAKKVLCIIGDENTIGQEKFTNFIIEQIRKNGIIVQSIEFDGFSRGDYYFSYQQYFKSGVFQIKDEINQVKQKKKKKKKNKKKQQNNEQQSYIQIQKENQDLKNYFQEIIDEFMIDKNRSHQIIYKKYDNNEYEVLQNLICQTDNLQIEKQKNKIILQKNIQNDQQKHQVIQQEELQQDEKIITENDNIIQQQEFNKPKKSKKKKKKKPKVEQNLTEEQQEQKNLEFIEKLNQENELKRKKCSREDSKGKWCNKNISLNYFDCNFCNQRFCTKHVIAENHGCGDAARDRERNKLFYENKNNFEKQDQRNIAYLQRKLKDQIQKKKDERKPQNKKKKKK